jgi:putative ABC transport system permease protein
LSGVLKTALTLALREMRGGLRDFPVLLICLCLGVAAIAGVGSIRAAIQNGLDTQAATILGGDAQIQFTYRFADDEERAWMEENALLVSELADFRSMATTLKGDEVERSLTQVKAVDNAYPIYGEIILDPAIPLSEALETRDRPGAVVEQALLDRLDIDVGDKITLGTQQFDIRAVIVREPDATGAGFAFGPRTIVKLDALEQSGLLAAGTLFDSAYRLQIDQSTQLSDLETRANAAFSDTGLRWRDSRNASPGIARAVDRIGAFLVLVGLAGLIVGGIGVSAAVRSYLGRKTSTIATLKTLGARGREIFAIYFIQIGLMAILGITAGVALGTLTPIILGNIFASALPVPAVFTIYPQPILEAALYGLLASAIFSLWPLARARDIRAADLFRDAATSTKTLPKAQYLIAVAVLTALLIASAAYFSGVPTLTLWVSFGLAASFLALLAVSFGTHKLAKYLAGTKLPRRAPATHLALRAIGAAGNDAAPVILSMGLGLTVLAAIAQIDANLQNRIETEFPDIAPSYFVVDIQNDQLDPFLNTARADAAVTQIETAPMLRGVINRINGQPAKETAGDHWVLNGDRGVSYADTKPDDAILTAGDWWPEDYQGPPLVSFAEEEGLEMGLSVGDEITVNILGRDLTATIANFREVDFSSMGINFIMIMNDTALAGAPHSHIATVYADAQADSRLVRSFSEAFPNITAIGVRDAIARVGDALAALSSAMRWGASATLLTGFVVLIGAAAAGERKRTYEAAILKTLGATRARILSSFAIRSLILGFAAGLIALIAGATAAWAVMTFVMEAEFTLAPASAISIIIGGALANLAAGLLFSYRSLSMSASGVLRARD